MIATVVGNLPIRHKLLLAVLLPGVASLLVAGVMLFTMETAQFKHNAAAELTRLATVVGNRSVAALMFHDLDLANENLAVLGLQPAVRNACLYGADDQLFASLHGPGRPPWDCPRFWDASRGAFEDQTLVVAAPITDPKDGAVGGVLVMADFSHDYWRKLEFIALMFLVLVAVSVLVFLLFSPLILLIARPVQQLAGTVNAIIGTRDYALRAQKVHNDELGLLVEAFNDLIGTVQAQHKALSQARDRYLMLYDDNPTMVFNLSASGEILAVNKTGASHLGLAVEVLQECSIFEFVHPADVHMMDELIAACLANPLTVHKQELRQVCHHGRITWVRAAGRLLDNEAQAASLLLVCEDVTETHHLSEQIAYQASHDGLTGLANRSAFDRAIAEAMRSVQDKPAEHALCYLDLDQFKIVNDTCGHLAGDEMLRQLADVLRKQVRRQDFIARLGGDEFGVLMYHCPMEHALEACEKLRDAIGDFRFNWEGRQFVVGVSIGVSMINPASGGAAHSLKEADAACYAAKDRGRNRVHIYRPDDAELALRHGEMQWVNRIQHGLRQDHFRLYAQPIRAVAAIDHDGLHLEVLLRYQDSQSIIPPGAFLPAAERYNLAPMMDRWVVGQLFACLGGQRAFLDRLSLCAVNLSGLSLSDEHMLEFITQQFQMWDIPRHKICFEITETAVIANLSCATAFINALRGDGCLFALDDFGSGLSSFGYLKNLPVDFIKIDGLFIKDMVEDPVDLAMVRSINEVGHIIGKKTIAEFVESEQILSLVKELGVDYGQGYFLGKPEPLQTVIDRAAEAEDGRAG